MLATEEHATPLGDRRGAEHGLETWPRNEVMRHIPSLDWITRKVDDDLRRRVEHLWASYADLPFANPHHAHLEIEFRCLCRALERIADTARHHRGHAHAPNELGARITWALNDVVAALNAVNSETFGHRYPCHTGERSGSEPLWASVLAAISQVQKLVELVREVDPTIDERMYEGLVQLQEPLRREPIA